MDKVTISEEDRRQLGLWAADCVERALPLFEAKAPADPRPREAIEGIRAFAREGSGRTAKLRSLAWAANAAARDVDDPAATAAARAACHAAATPYIHPLATPHQSKHVLGPAVYEALARELAVGDAAGADEEIRWAIEHAPQEVRALLRQMPARSPGRSRLDTLYYELDAALRRSE
ncbi:putative immunity protein [Streptomyces sp. NPDC058682]|uniref:putative immunity protein n=1 Tax=unclassified Streptomyces TaxID=2593676 RepID=UPI00224D7807|nr:hypothetical protein [Streptomyces sp. NBC_01214]MCX4800664.1 hypothetical protein [Streptomyces sp. NBC_01214]